MKTSQKMTPDEKFTIFCLIICSVAFFVALLFVITVVWLLWNHIVVPSVAPLNWFQCATFILLPLSTFGCLLMFRK